MPYWRGWGAVHMTHWMQTSTTRWLRGCLSSFNNWGVCYCLMLVNKPELSTIVSPLAGRQWPIFRYRGTSFSLHRPQHTRSKKICRCHVHWKKISFIETSLSRLGLSLVGCSVTGIRIHLILTFTTTTQHQTFTYIPNKLNGFDDV